MLHFVSIAQDNSAFENEVERLVQKYKEAGWEKGGIVLTGSSSIRLWNNYKEDFSHLSIVNTGFGGSQMSDLLRYLDPLVLDFSPSKIFIYEGDNDVNSGKTTEAILNEFKELIKKVKNENPNIEVYIIGVKPSPSRWDLKDDYLRLNDSFQALTQNEKNTYFINMWEPMLDGQGNPDPSLFMGDMLHLNAQGYSIWTDQIKLFLK